MTKFSAARIIFFLFLITSFVSCDKGDDPVVVPCLIVSQALSSGQTYTFNYDGDVMSSFVVTGTAGTTVTTLEYESGKLVKLNFAGDVSNVLTYTGDDITRQERFSGTKVTDKTEYEYSGGNLVKIQEYNDSGAGLVKGDYRTFEYFSNSPDILRESRFADATSTTPTLTADYSMYGVDHAALSAVPPAMLKYFKLGGLPLNLNVVKITFSTGEEINYTYEVNEKGYPTKRTETYSNGIVNVQTNSYKCE